jgi:G:T-mismatch repair DNA endonuclease (very short patch repair protein)
MISPEHKAKLLAVNLGRTVSAETRAKISAANKGRKHTEETRQLISQVRKGNKNRLGVPHTEEMRAHLAEVLRRASPGSYNTKPEQLVQTWLSARGYAFEAHVREGGFNWDLRLFDEYRTLIEVNGCYWHSCPRCGLTGPSRVVERDAARREYAGDRLIIVWEHTARRLL